MKALVALLALAGAPLACARQFSEPPPQSAAQQWDGGLPPPPLSTRKGVVVPSDMGMGAGPAGPTTNGGATSPTSPVSGTPSN